MTTKTANTKNLFSDTRIVFTTRAATVARIEKVLSATSLESFGTFNYIIAANDNGTFTPVVILKSHQKFLSLPLAENGIAVAG
jgi:hypothetical protein